MWQLSYVWRHLRRQARGFVLTALTLAAASVLLLWMNGQLAAQQEELARLYADFEITCTVSNVSGSDTQHLNITPKYYELCYKEGGKLYDHTADLLLSARVPVYGLYEGEESPLTRAEEDKAVASLVAVTALPDQMAVTYRQGYEAADMGGAGLYCLIPEGLTVGETLALQLNREAEATAFHVIGTYRADTAAVDLYVPFGAFETVAHARGVIPYANSMTFTLADNRRLDEAKEIMQKYFLPVGSDVDSAWGSQLAMSVHDGLFLDSVRMIERSIRLYGGMLVLLYLLTAGLATLVCFFTVRGRRRELAMLRSMGAPRRLIYGLVYAEYIPAFLVSVPTVAALFALVWVPVDGGAWAVLGICFLCYLAGIGVAAWLCSRGHIMTTVKGGE